MDARDKGDLKRLLKKRRDELSAKLRRVDEALRDLDSESEGTDKISAELLSGDAKTPLLPYKFGAPFPLDKIRGLTQKDAMIVIARHYGGMLRTRDLIKHMQAAGIMSKTTKNAGSMTWGLINNSEQFERVATGLYKLREDGAQSEIQTGPHGMIVTTPGRLTN